MDDAPQPTRSRRLEAIAVVSFVLINLASPFVVGELYPFTISPMFSDEPQVYCEYELYSQDGTRLDLEAFGLQRNYDGNPPGIGVGIRPPETLDRFGEVPTESELRSHLAGYLDDRPDIESLRVVRRVIGALDDRRVGELDDRRLEFVIESGSTGP